MAVKNTLEIFEVSTERACLIIDVLSDRLEDKRVIDIVKIAMQIIEDLSLNDNEKLLLGSYLHVVLSDTVRSSVLIMHG
jgi:hypothetical protein